MPRETDFGALEFIRSLTGPPYQYRIRQILIETAQMLVDADFVQLALPDSPGWLRVVAVFGSLAPAFEAYNVPLPAAAQKAVRHVEAVVDPARDPVLADEGIVSALALVIPLESNTVSVLLVGSRSPRSFTHREAQRLQRLGEQAQPALLHVRAMVGQERNRAEADALLRADRQLNEASTSEDVMPRVVGTIAELLEATRCTIVTYDGNEARIRYFWRDGVWHLPGTVVSLETSVSGWVIQNRKAYRGYDPAGDHRFTWRTITPPKSLLCVPMSSRDGGIRGVIALLDRNDGRPFSERQQHLVEGIAQLATVAVERADLTAELRRSEQWYRDLFDNANELIITRDFLGQITSVNPAWELVTGYSQDELLGMNIEGLVVPAHRPRLQEHATRLLAGEKLAPRELDIVAKDGRIIPIEFAPRLVYEDGSPVAVQSIGRDISDRKALEEHLTRQALYDPLTGLPNRSLFMDRLRHALRVTGRSHVDVTVLFMDLDDFKEINDTQGHSAGDEALVAAGQRLASCLRPGDTLARFGGDEFTVLLGEQTEPRAAVRIADRLHQSLQEPFQVSRQQRTVAVSIGVASTELVRLQRPEDLLHAADIALYQAKRAGKGQTVIYVEGMAGPSTEMAAQAHAGEEGATGLRLKE